MKPKRNSENDLGLAAGASATPSFRKPASRPRAKHVVSPETPATAATEPETLVSRAVTATLVNEPSREEIAALAYLYWEARGCQGGSPAEDWLRAEQELRLRTATSIA